MAGNRTQNVVKNSSAGLIQRVVQMLVQFALRTAFIRLLGKEYTGISGLFTDILQVLSLMELGLDSSMVYALYKPLVEGDARRISALLKFYKKAFTVIGCLVLAAGALCTPLLPYIVKGVPNIKENISFIFLMYVLTTGSSYFLIYKSVLLRADQKSRIINYVATLVSLAECVLAILLLIVFKNFYAYLIVHLVATLGKNIIISRIAANSYKEYFAASDAVLSRKEKAVLYKNLACLSVYTTSGVVINSTDSIFISAFVGTVEVAIIGNFTMIITSLRSLINQVVSASMPSVGNLAATSTGEKQEEVFKRMNFLIFWIGCIGCTCLFNLLNPFVGEVWFDPSYKTTLPVLALLVVNFFIAVISFPVEAFRGSNGLFVQGWMRPAIMAVMNIVLDYFWGKRWGIMGIFAATTVSRVLTQVWFDPWLVYRKVFGSSVKPYFIRTLFYALLTVASCAAAYGICAWLPLGSGLFSLLVKALICLLVSNAAILLVFGRSEELGYVKGIIRKIGNKIKKKLGRG